MTGIILPLAAQIRPGMVMPDGDSLPQAEGGDSFTADAGEPALLLPAGPVPVPEGRADPLRDWLEDRAGISAGIGAETGAEESVEGGAEISAAMPGEDPAMTDAAPPDVPQTDRAPVAQPANSGTQDTGRQNAGLRDTGLRDPGLQETVLRDTGLRDTGQQTTAPRVAEAPRVVPDMPDPTTLADPAGAEGYSRPEAPAAAEDIPAPAPRPVAAPTPASPPAVAVMAASAPLAATVSTSVAAPKTARVDQIAEIDSSAVAPKPTDQTQDPAKPVPVGPAILQAVGRERPAASAASEPVAGRAVTTDEVARNSTAADAAQPAAMPASPPAAATRVAATMTANAVTANAAMAATTSPPPAAEPAAEQAAGIAMDPIMRDGRARPDPRAGGALPAATATDRAALPPASPGMAAPVDSVAQDSAAPDRQVGPRQAADAPPDRQPARPVAGASEPAADRLIRVTPPGPALPEVLRSDPVDPGSAADRVTGRAASAPQGEPAKPEAVAPVLRQISGALVTSRAGATEIMLAPEELGRLHMIWTGHDRPQLVLWAERPETLDLLRRNIDLLTAELQEAGVNAGLLDFRDGPPPELPGQARRDMPPEPDEAAQAQRIAVAASTSLAAGATRLASARRIDVRL